MILKSSFSKVQNGKITVCIEDQNNYEKKNQSYSFSLQFFILEPKSNMEEGTNDIISESKDELVWLLIKVLNKTNHHLDALFDKKSDTSNLIS